MIFGVQGQDWNFSEHGLSLSPWQNIEWLWKLDFSAELILFLNKLNLELQGKIALTYETYTTAKSLDNYALNRKKCQATLRTSHTIKS